MVCGWWLVVCGWWLVVGSWWFVDLFQMNQGGGAGLFCSIESGLQ